MGYTVQSARDMVAVGISAIGDVQGAFVQNVKKLPAYGQAIAEGRFPVEKGYALTGDDTLRRHVITELMCNARLDLADVDRALRPPVRGAVRDRAGRAQGPRWPGRRRPGGTDSRMDPAHAARPALRAQRGMIFDRHLREDASGEKPVFSRTV